METKFNFKSQVCTSVDQSRRLLELGLKKETADMHYSYLRTNGDYELTATAYADLLRLKDRMNNRKILGMGWDELYGNNIPAWSLHRLIEMMPMTLIEDKEYHESWDLNITPLWVIYRNQDTTDDWIGECLGQGMYNNIIDCIEWLIKEGYFNKEYLV